jgi:hypothetical protein
MFELYKREKPIGSYSSFASATVIANRMRGDERAQRFTIVGPKGQQWEAMLPPKGAGRARWEKAA